MTSEPVDPYTLDFILDATKGGPADQFRNMESHDSKIHSSFCVSQHYCRSYSSYATIR